MTAMLPKIRVVDVNEIHFNKGDKAKYRKHLTYLVILGATASIVTIIWGSTPGATTAVVVHLIRDLYWVWE
jgi:hypothetical protein